jgi:hypothetical protein
VAVLFVKSTKPVAENNLSQRIIEGLFNDNKAGSWEFYLSDDYGTTKRFDGALKSHSTETPNIGLVSTTITIAVRSPVCSLVSRF